MDFGLNRPVVYYGEPNDRSLQTVRTLLSSPEKLQMAIKLMCASDAWDGIWHAWETSSPISRTRSLARR